jgi:hypothetical protein
MASANKAGAASTGGLMSIIGPFLRITSTALAARGLREAAAAAGRRALLTAGAGVGGGIALFCFSNTALTLLERRMDPAEAWSIVGGAYGLAAGALYFAATKRRRV